MTSQTLRNPEEAPPGGFRYFQQETQQWIKAASLPELFTEVKKHRKANELPIGLMFQQEVESQLCSFMPPGVCHYTDPAQRKRANQIGRSHISKMMDVTRLLFARIKGETKVTLEEANEHAKGCVKCSFNQPAIGCTSCNSGARREVVDAILGSHQDTKYHGRLQACIICGCDLRAKVWYKPEVIRRISDTSALPDWCWILERKEQ